MALATAEQIQAVKERQAAGENLTEEETAILSDEGKAEIKGVKYELNADGEYCLNGVPVLDKEKVPFYNRGKEVDRVKFEAEQNRLALEARHKKELETALKPPITEPNLDDVDPETGLTYGQLKGIEKRIEGKILGNINQVENRTANMQAQQNIKMQKHQLANNPKYKSFFENDQYAKEIDKCLANVSLEVALMPDVVEQAVKLVIGGHYDELVKEENKRAIEKAMEDRQIVGEVKLGKSGGSLQERKIKVTPEIERAAQQMKISLEAAAEIITNRNERRKQKK